MYKKYEHKSTIQIEKYHIETLFLIIVNGSDELYIHTIKTKNKLILSRSKSLQLTCFLLAFLSIIINVMN